MCVCLEHSRAESVRSDVANVIGKSRTGAEVDELWAASLIDY